MSFFTGRLTRLMTILALGLPAAISPAAATDPAAAAQESDQLEEVYVTARKREERLIDIPESISVISAEDLTDRGITSIEDVGRQTPNLQLNTRQDLTTDVVIRGVGAYGDVLGVGFNVDDVPNFTDQTTRPQDLESVEILKGPQGTLYGGSSIGGLVRYVSKKPAFNWDGEFTAETGNYSTINLTMAQNVPIIDQVLAMRVSGYDSKSDGYITNNELGINGSPLTDYGVRAAFLFKPDDVFDALLTLRHSFTENGSDEYIPVTAVKNYSLNAPFYQPTYNIRNVWGVVLEMNADLHFAKLTSISSWTTAGYQLNADVSQTPAGIPGLTFFTVNGNRPTEVSTQELRLTSQPGTFEWLVGGYGDMIKDVLLNDVDQQSFYPTSPPSLLNDFDTTRTDAAVFGTASYHIGPVRLDAGVRLNRTVNAAEIYTPGTPTVTSSIVTQSALPKFSISYKLPNDEQVYASVAKGEEPGAINVAANSPLPYRAETATSYELGTKGESADRKVDYSLAAFYVLNKDHQYETNIFDTALGGFVTLISNIGNSRTYGAEGSLNWHVTDELRLGGTAGYLNAKWTRAEYFGAALDGNEIPNAPQITTSLNSAYSRPVFSTLRFEANFDVNYSDAMWWDLPNTPGTREPPHFLSDARIALGSDHRGWQVALRISNLFNQRYWTEYYPQFFAPVNQPCSGCSDMGAPGAPREVFGSFSYKY